MKLNKSVEILPSSDNIEFSYLGRRPRIEKSRYKEWLNRIAKEFDYSINSLNYTFCTDDELLKINIEYLNHDFYTDIITFDLSDKNKTIEGDIYISVDRVKDNAKINNVTFEHELKRVCVHGLLHLMGFKDKNKKDISKMRNAENNAILQF